MCRLIQTDVLLKDFFSALNKLKGFFGSERVQMFCMMMVVGSVAMFAQNAAGNYEAGTTALTTVTEENAFWINHTQIKYDKMNIKLKKTRYK